MMTLRVAVIGSGRIAQTVHLPVLASMPRVKLAALADPDPVARKAAERWTRSAPVFADCGELLESAEVDAAVICTPNEVHAETAMAALERGKHVYLEKPLATSVADGRALVEAWRRSEAVAMIGFNYRAHPVYERARALIESGHLGEILGVRTVFTSASRASGGWEQSRRTGGGLLLRRASHHIDLVRFLLHDDVGEVSAALRLGTDDEVAGLQLRLASGVPVQSFFSDGPTDDDQVEIYGTSGRLTVDRHRARADLEPARPRRSRGRGMGGGNPLRGLDRLRKRAQSSFEPSYRRALTRFVDAAISGERATPDLEDGYRSLAVVDAAEEAAKTGRVVSPTDAADDKATAR